MDERIELYFNEELPLSEKEKFERELLQNSLLAEEVAFYLRTKQEIRKQILAERHAEWQKGTFSPQTGPIREQKPAWPDATPSWRPGAHPTVVLTPQAWYYAMAAILILTMGLAWFWFSASSPGARQMADAYIETQLYVLPTTMGDEKDSLKQAKKYYEEGQFEAAGKIMEALLQQKPEDEEYLRTLGTIRLRQKNYGQAIAHFHRMSELNLAVNPGTFYEALAYLQRNQPQDPEKARELLQKVVQEDLDGREEAQKLLAAMETSDPRPDL